MNMPYGETHATSTNYRKKQKINELATKIMALPEEKRPHELRSWLKLCLYILECQRKKELQK